MIYIRLKIIIMACKKNNIFIAVFILQKLSTNFKLKFIFFEKHCLLYCNTVPFSKKRKHCSHLYYVARCFGNDGCSDSNVYYHLCFLGFRGLESGSYCKSARRYYGENEGGKNTFRHWQSHQNLRIYARNFTFFQSNRGESIHQFPGQWWYCKFAWGRFCLHLRKSHSQKYFLRDVSEF